MGNDVQRLLQIAAELQQLVDTDPHAFGVDYELGTLRECIEAWEAVTASADMFLKVVKQDRGIADQ